MKSTVEEIRQRFDADVERFSNLETGQSATVDAPLALALVAEAATASLVPTRSASSGVSRLPMPKPLTEAMAPARTATAATSARKIVSEGITSL
jgi:hypothetical protein